MFISVVWSRWLEGSISRSSLQFHFLQTLEHRTDVSVTSTSPWWEAPEERGVPWVPAGPCGLCWGPSAPHAVPLLSPQVSALHWGGSCQWCPSWEGVLGITWSLKPPWCSPAACLPPPSLSWSHWDWKPLDLWLRDTH